MPRVLWVGAFQFYIWPNDHPPAHVHVIVGDSMIVIELGEGPESVTLSRASRDSRNPDVRMALALTAEHWQTLSDAWKRIHD